MTKSALQFRRFKSNTMAFVFMAYYRPNHKFHKKKTIYYCAFIELKSAHFYQIFIFPFCNVQF